MGRNLVRLTPGVLCLAAFFTVSLWGWAIRPPAASRAADVTQARLDTPPPIPDATTVLAQSFTSRRDGLNAITLTAIRYPDAEQPPAGTLTLALRDANGALRAAHTWSAAEITHNQELRLAFAPLSAAADRSFTLTVTGSDNRSVTVWGTGLDAHAGGALTVSGRPDPVQDLAFTTEYTLSGVSAAGDLVNGVRAAAPLLVAAALVLPLPGLLWLSAVPSTRPRRATRAGIIIAIGCALWPLLWQWSTVAGVRWRTSGVWAVVAAGWLAVFLLRRRRRAAGLDASYADAGRIFSWKRAIGIALLLAAGYAVRLLAARDLAFLPWVDASRHALITAATMAQGQLLRTYLPFLEADAARYHYGFHALAATLGLLSGQSLRPLLLHLHQLLSALIPLALLAGARLLFGRRRPAGLVAAFLVALPFFLPAYYVSWGRLTQLTGALILPVLLGMTWRAARDDVPGRLVEIGVVWLTAGLFLIHARVLLLYLLFVPIAWLACRRPRLGRGLRLYGAATLLALPELVRLGRAGAVDLARAPDGYNALPVDYFSTGWERGFVAGAALAGAVAVALLLARRRSADAPAAALFAWVGLTAATFFLLPNIWLLNTNSAVILLFIPTALLLEWAAGAGIALLGRLPPAAGYAAALLLGATVAWTVRFAVPYQLDIVAEQTVLATAADADALAWIDANLPADALVAHSAWQWLGTAWAGRDGAAWLLPLTGVQTSTPPVDYIYAADRVAAVTAFNEAALAVADWSTPAAAALLRAHGMTHVYVGTLRDGFLQPEALRRNPELRLLYAVDGVFIFELRPPRAP